MPAITDNLTDSDAGRAISSASYDATLNFLSVFLATGPEPVAFCTEDGRMGFYWEHPQGCAELIFARDGMGSFFLRRTNGQCLCLDEVGADQYAQVMDALGAL